MLGRTRLFLYVLNLLVFSEIPKVSNSLIFYIFKNNYQKQGAIRFTYITVGLLVHSLKRTEFRERACTRRCHTNCMGAAILKISKIFMITRQGGKQIPSKSCKSHKLDKCLFSEIIIELIYGVGVFCFF